MCKYSTSTSRLWIFLALELDTEEHVYRSLYELFGQQHFALTFSAMYFYRMKIRLTAQEMTTVKTYYDDDDHITELEQWNPSWLFDPNQLKDV